MSLHVGEAFGRILVESEARVLDEFLERVLVCPSKSLHKVLANLALALLFFSFYSCFFFNLGEKIFMDSSVAGDGCTLQVGKGWLQKLFCKGE